MRADLFILFGGEDQERVPFLGANQGRVAKGRGKEESGVLFERIYRSVFGRVQR